MRIAKEGSGRYDHLHGDEPEIEAYREETRRLRDEARADEPLDEIPPCECVRDPDLDEVDTSGCPSHWRNNL